MREVENLFCMSSRDFDMRKSANYEEDLEESSVDNESTQDSDF